MSTRFRYPTADDGRDAEGNDTLSADALDNLAAEFESEPTS